MRNELNKVLNQTKEHITNFEFIRKKYKKIFG